MKDGFSDGELLGASVRRGHPDLDVIVIIEVYTCRVWQCLRISKLVLQVMAGFIDIVQFMDAALLQSLVYIFEVA